MTRCNDHAHYIPFCPVFVLSFKCIIRIFKVFSRTMLATVLSLECVWKSENIIKCCLLLFTVDRLKFKLSISEPLICLHKIKFRPFTEEVFNKHGPLILSDSALQVNTLKLTHYDSLICLYVWVSICMRGYGCMCECQRKDSRTYRRLSARL